MAYELRFSDWSSDVCSSDLVALPQMRVPVGVAQLVADQAVGGVAIGDAQQRLGHAHQQHALFRAEIVLAHEGFDRALVLRTLARSEEHTSELQSLMRISYAVFCLKKKI